MVGASLLLTISMGSSCIDPDEGLNTLAGDLNVLAVLHAESFGIGHSYENWFVDSYLQRRL